MIAGMYFVQWVPGFVIATPASVGVVAATDPGRGRAVAQIAGGKGCVRRRRKAAFGDAIFGAAVTGVDCVVDFEEHGVLLGGVLRTTKG